jgi:general secretion pathway protein G
MEPFARRRSPRADRPDRSRPGRAQAGYTLAELVMVASIMVTLAAVALPVAKFTTLRGKENELRGDLRDVRLAIDEYKRYADSGLIQVDLGTDGYPPKLDVLVEGVPLIGQVDKKVKFLRRVPIDPLTGKAEWGQRSYQDAWDATSWGGEDVYDVYSLAGGVGMNGTAYRKW